MAISQAQLVGLIAQQGWLLSGPIKKIIVENMANNLSNAALLESTESLQPIWQYHNRLIRHPNKH